MLKIDRTGTGKGRNLMRRPKKRAKRKFDPGPARATLTLSHLASLKLYGLMGTGFAQPKIKGKIVGAPRRIGIAKISGKIIEPKGSMCGIGFKVRRPAYFAVGSPKA